MQTDVIAVKQTLYFPCSTRSTVHLVCVLKQAVRGKAGEIHTLVQLGGASCKLLSISLSASVSLRHSGVDDVCCKHFIDAREKSLFVVER